MITQRPPIISKKQWLALVVLVFLAVLSVLIISSRTQPEDTSPAGDRITAPSQQAAVAASSTRLDPFADITISALSAFVLDTKTQKVLYTKKPDEQLPLASITKLMTAALARELIDPATPITISADAIAQDGESPLAIGETYTAKNLTDIVLTSSSNDGAYALAETAGALFRNGGPAEFVQAMNIKSEELGLTKTYFRNPTGLDVAEGKSGSYGTARDVAFLMQDILFNKPEILSATSFTTLQVPQTNGTLSRIDNTNYYAESINGLVGSKTGYTELAGGNLVIAFEVEPNHTIVAVVLGSSREGRFTDIQKLVTASYASF